MGLVKLSDQVELSTLYDENRDAYQVILNEYTIGAVYQVHCAPNSSDWAYEHRESGACGGAVSYENAIEALYLTEINS